MKDNKNTFILAGHGPDNRGNEAIIRGTIKILRHYFDSPKFLVLGFYSTKKQIEEESLKETDADIIYKGASTFGKLKPARILNRIALSCLNDKKRSNFVYKDIIPYLERSRAVLSVGGDNYSFDYGKPTLFTDLDNLVLSKNKPIIIWGASVGPFNKDIKYENYIKEHFKKITGIFARESITMEYLSSIGVFKNVYRVADPAFLLDPIEPADDKIDKKKLNGTIGLNISPLMAEFVTGGNLKEWAKISSDIIKETLIKNKKPICLVSHVTDYRSNDYEFMKKTLSFMGKSKDMVTLLPNNLNAAETKWAISKMDVFAGSRTHSVISALSSIVPALSFTYSIKGRGIVQDVYGNDYFSVSGNQLKPEIIAEKIHELIEERKEIREQISLNLPKIKGLAMNAGKYLKELLLKNDNHI